MILLLEATVVIGVAGTVALAGRFLDWKGALAGALLGYIYYLGGGRLHFASVLTFLVVGGLATRYRYREKHGEKRGVRTWSNVLANGTVAAGVAGYAAFSQMDRGLGLAMFMGAVSAAFTDTMATELGMLSRRKPVTITSLREAEPGTPGAVTPEGLTYSLVAPVSLTAVIAVLDSGLAGQVHLWLAITVFTGFIGSVLDSVVGALFQSRYRCVACGRAVEVRKHCGVPTQYVGGSRYFNNDTVNLVATLSGALSGYLLGLLLL
ncbi:hypothetical protein HRbin01_01641 [archaeon HR01]|nr:hypothetical protein HRbin01_01641 [archaeon HR01]